MWVRGFGGSNPERIKPEDHTARLYASMTQGLPVHTASETIKDVLQELVLSTVTSPAPASFHQLALWSGFLLTFY